MKSFTSQVRTTKSKSKHRNTFLNKGKRQCELGQNCPYKSEYQHQLEFDHGTTAERSNNNSSEKNIPFIGRGHKLGTISGVEHPMQPKVRKVDNVSNRAPHSRVDNSPNSFYCEICKANVLLAAMENHMHFPNENNAIAKRDSVRMEQDEAYEQSLLTDIVEMAAKEEKLKELERQQKKKAEREALERVMMDSFQEELRAKRSLAASRVLPEPSSEVDPKLVTKLKLRMPDSSVITRRFLVDNSVEELFTFLVSQQSLVGFEVALREVFGDAVVWNQASTGSFRQLKLVNCAVVVIAEPVEPPAPVTDSPSDKGRVAEERAHQPSSSSSASASSLKEREGLKDQGTKPLRAPTVVIPSTSSSSSSSSSSLDIDHNHSPRKRQRKTFAAPSQSSICVIDLT